MKILHSRVFVVTVFVLIAVAMSFTTGIVASQVVYHGNTKSKIFHSPSCRHYNCKNCTMEFSDRQEAIDAGYRPCKICKP